ncbi:hypothetical protein MKZ38_004884 [Zalerion maritima]|uniref:Saccharopine dehydrogenase NADP binding domain-containing protein n=1 Tax=Zalerion maritima TaxID=339359 RepID=A0AAD5WUC8_9PEZI|nr:hypothetical protein MKZ38_004884 [Zalerion maritima]
MTLKDHGRGYDVVVFGATGYTGKLTAEHITTHLPTNLKWAVAGRSQGKLEKVVEEIKALNPDRLQPSIEICNLDSNSLAELAKKTCILITTVGPYARYGEHAFKACAENGTHYLDVTGEVPYVHKMIKKYEAAAKMTGAIMIPEIGVESAPSDLMAWSLVKTNRIEFGAKTKETVISLHKLVSVPSGGTLDTVLSILDEFTLQEIKESFTPFTLSPVPHPGPVSNEGLFTKIFGLRVVPNLGQLTTSVTASTDTAIVGRSWGLMKSIPSRQKQAYGPKFVVHEYLKTRNVLTGLYIHFSLAIATLLLFLLPSLRTFIRRFIYQPGEGPTKEEAAKDEVEFRGVAWPDIEEGGKETKGAGKQAYGRAIFFGSMYYLTGTLLAQAALTILEDDLELEGGVYTPACLGQPFIDRLAPSGFRIETKVIDEK